VNHNELQKLFRRHKTAVLTASVVALALLLAVIVLAVSNVRIASERNQKANALRDREVALAAAQQSDRGKSEQLWHALVAQARANRTSGRPGRRFQTLETLKRATELAHTLNLPSESFLELRNAVIATLALPDLYLGPPWIPWSEEIALLDADEAHAMYVRIDSEGNSSIRRVTDDVELYHLPGQRGISRANFSRDGKYISIVHCDNQRQSLAIEIWRLEGPNAQCVLNEPDAHFASFLRSQQVAVSHHDGSIRVFDLPSGAELHRLPPATLKRELIVALHPAEPLLAACSYFDSVVQVRDLRTGQVLASLPQTDPPISICWDPSGRTLAVGYGNNAPIRLYDHATLPSYRTLTTESFGTFVVFNSTGDRLLCISWGGILEVFDVGTGQRILASLPNVIGTRVNADNTRYFGAYDGRRFGIFDLADGREYRNFFRRPLPGTIEYLHGAVSPDGELLAVSATDGVGLWDLETGREVGFVHAESRANRVLFQPSGSLLTLVPGGLLRWPIAYDPKARHSPIAGPPERVALPFGDDLAQSGDGRIIVSCDRSVGTTQRDAGGWILDTGHPGKPIHLDIGNDIGRIMISPDGRWVFTCNKRNASLNVFDARDGALVKSIPHGGALVLDGTTSASCFSPDGRWMAIGADGGRLLELGSWNWGPRVSGMVQFAPAGNFYGVATNAGIRLFDQTTHREFALLEDPSLDFAEQILFAPDASKIISINRNSGIRVWDLRLIRRQLKTMGLDWQTTNGT